MNLKASELILQLQEQIVQHGDLPVYVMGDFCHEAVTDVAHDSFIDGPDFFFLRTDPRA